MKAQRCDVYVGSYSLGRKGSCPGCTQLQISAGDPKRGSNDLGGEGEMIRDCFSSLCREMTVELLTVKRQFLGCSEGTYLDILNWDKWGYNNRVYQLSDIDELSNVKKHYMQWPRISNGRTWVVTRV